MAMRRLFYKVKVDGKTRWVPVNYQHCPVCLATIMDTIIPTN
jgi:hypothetical protein